MRAGPYRGVRRPGTVPVFRRQRAGGPGGSGAADRLDHQRDGVFIVEDVGGAEGAAEFAVDGPADLVIAFEKDIGGAEHTHQRPVVILQHQGA